MNKRITNKVAKRRANSPQAVELRRWLLELVTAKRAYEALEDGRLSPSEFSVPGPPSQNVLVSNYDPKRRS